MTLPPLPTRNRTARTLASLGVLAVLAVAPATPAVTQENEAQPASEIERFCSNISDAARDRRYALEEQQLESLKKEIDARVAALEEKRAEYEAWLKRREDFLAKAEDNVVEIYSKMRPDAAAGKLAVLGPDLAAGILMKLDARKSSVILNEMDVKAAATLTQIMAAAAREKDPT